MAGLQKYIVSNCSKERKYNFTTNAEGIVSIGGPLATTERDCTAIPKNANTSPFGQTPIKLMIKTLNK
jgi:hypothetical protein